MGDDAAFQYTIHTTLINPFIGCVLPHLVQKTIEYLAFGCTDDTLDRLLCFLKVLVQNYHSRDVANNEEYFHLCNLFVCLLFGRIDMKSKMAHILSERSKIKKIRKTVKSPTSDTQQQPQQQFDKVKTELDETSATNCSNTKMYLGMVPNPVAFEIKEETTDDQRPFELNLNRNCDGNTINNMDHQDDLMCDATKNADIKIETELNSHDKCTNNMSETTKKSSGNIIRNLDEMYSPFVTDACDDRFIDELCSLIGCLSGKWGYFEHEMTYLLYKRLEIFFFEHRNPWSAHDFKWLRRIIQALSALGETAFRELTLYFEYIPYEQYPEWLIPYLSYGAIYIRGRKDYYFYEYMAEICGDSLQPFLMYYSKYIEKLLKRMLTQRKQQKTPPIKISTKFLLVLTQKSTTTTHTGTIDELFPDRSPPIQKPASVTSRRIGFKFAGCCPVLAKSTTLKLNAEQKFVQSTELNSKLNRFIVIAKRKMLKSVYINGYTNFNHLLDNRQYNI